MGNLSNGLFLSIVLSVVAVVDFNTSYSSFLWLLTESWELPKTSVVDSNFSHETWYCLYGGLFLIFYFFSSPFMGSREMRDKWTGYVYFSVFLYAWLFLSIVSHMPSVYFDFQVPVSLFPYFFLLSCLAQSAVIIPYRLIVGKFFNVVFHIGFTRRWFEIMQNSIVIGIACCIFYANCGNSTEPSDNPVCVMLRNDNHRKLPDVSVLWSTCISVVFVNYALELVTQNRYILKDQHNDLLQAASESVNNRNTSSVIEDESKDEVCEPVYPSGGRAHPNLRVVIPQSPAKGSRAPDIPTPRSSLEMKYPQQPTQLPMVSWYSLVASETLFDVLIQLKVFLGRFDMRMMELALSSLNDSENPKFTDLSEREDFWFDFMADCGDGWNSSYQVARLLAQPHLDVKFQKGPKTQRLLRGNLLVIGGDLAYPKPSAKSYEERFFRPFESALPPPPHYCPDAVASEKPALPNGVNRLCDYNGPICFAIPGNHDWYDGLETYTRMISFRDWLGGWLLPQQNSYFAIKLPKGWWLLGFDNALNDDIDPYQLRYFARIAKQMLPTDRVILVTHEPEWVLNDYFKTNTNGKNIRHLMNTHLNGKVALRLAGDLHHYTRHEPLEKVELNHTKTELKEVTPDPDPDPDPGSETAHRRKRHSDSFQFTKIDNIDVRTWTVEEVGSWLSQIGAEQEQKRFADNLVDGKELLSFAENPTLLETRMKMNEATRVEKILNRIKELRKHIKPGTIPPPRKHVLASKSPTLVVSGGGGAFMHPTHLTKHPIQFNNETYVRRKCYPPESVSQRYAILNILGFRVRNFQFDVFGGVIFFLLVFSLFPVCHIQADFQTWQDVVLQPLSDVGFLICKLLSSSYISLLTAMACVVGMIYATEPHFSPMSRFAIGTVHAMCHVVAAIVILVVMETSLAVGVRHGFLGQTNLFEKFVHNFPSLKVFLDEHSWYRRFGVSFVFQLLDLPEFIAELRTEICESGARHTLFQPDIPIQTSVTRLDFIFFYASYLLFFWVLATPMSSFVVGTYLYISANILNTHITESFSSLRIESYKNFVRLHITDSGDIEAFVVGIQKVPRKWRKNSLWSGKSWYSSISTPIRPSPPSYTWESPSLWVPHQKEPDMNKVSIVDHFTISKT